MGARGKVIAVVVLGCVGWWLHSPSPSPGPITQPPPAPPIRDRLALMPIATPPQPAWHFEEEPMAPEGLLDLAEERGELLLRCDLSGLPMPAATDEEPWAGRLAVVRAHDAGGRPLGTGALQLQDDILSSLVHADATRALMTWQGHRYAMSWPPADAGTEVWCDQVDMTARLVRLTGRLVLPDEAPRDVDYRLTVCEQPVRVSAPDFRYDVQVAATPTPEGDRCLVNYGGPAVPDRELSRYTDWIFLTMEYVPLPEGAKVVTHDVVVAAPTPAPKPRSFEDFLEEQLERAADRALDDPQAVDEDLARFVEDTRQVLATDPARLVEMAKEGPSLVTWERQRPLREARRQAQEALGTGRKLLALDDRTGGELLTDGERDDVERLLGRIRSSFPDEVLWGSD